MLKNVLQKGLKKVAFMRRGDSFSDLSTYNAGYKFLTGNNDDSFSDIIDLQNDKFKFFDLVRIDTYIGSLSAFSEYGSISLFLRHSDNYGGDYYGVTLADVVGPKYIEEPFGGFKTFLEGTPFENPEHITDMGDKIYGIVYVGAKRYIRIQTVKVDPLATHTVLIWYTIAGINSYSKKYNRYNIYGASGGQAK